MQNFYRNVGNTQYSLRGDNRPGCLFLAEGDAEAFFLDSWLATMGASSADIAVICFKGESRLEAVLKNYAAEENFPYVKRFGFFLDADTDLASRKAAKITKLLRTLSLMPNTATLEAGVPLSVEGRKFALFVSPDNIGQGFIEHTVIREISSTELAGCIESFRMCVETTTGESVHPKTLVQAYIASHRPGLSGTGRGFESGVLNVMHNAYDDIRTALQAII